MSEEVQLEQHKAEDRKIVERDRKNESRPKAVSRERIERLKRAFRSAWLLEMASGPDKGSNSKKDK